MILLWFLNPQVASAVLAGKIVEEEGINLTSQIVPASILDDNVAAASTLAMMLGQ